MSKTKDRETGRVCDSCHCPTGTDVVLEGYPVVACPSCVASDFRRTRMVERARLAGVIK